MPDEGRIAALLDILQQNPEDAFARYALGLEYSGAGELDAALGEFHKLLAVHPDYTNGYFMSAQVLDRAGRTAEARAMLEQGIDSAQRSKNQHAMSEMQAMLDELQLRE